MGDILKDLQKKTISMEIREAQGWERENKGTIENYSIAQQCPTTNLPLRHKKTFREKSPKIFDKNNAPRIKIFARLQCLLHSRVQKQCLKASDGQMVPYFGSDWAVDSHQQRSSLPSGSAKNLQERGQQVKVNLVRVLQLLYEAAFDPPKILNLSVRAVKMHLYQLLRGRYRYAREGLERIVMIPNENLQTNYLLVKASGSVVQMNRLVREVRDIPGLNVKNPRHSGYFLPH